MRSSIEPMDALDLDTVMAIEEQSFPTPWTRAMFDSEIHNPNSHVLVSKERTENEYRIKGYICFWHVYDEVHILNLAVHPACRRQGVATELLSFAFDYSMQRRMTKVFLEVRIRNQPAHRLYQKIGFHLVGRRPGYYQDTGEDALVLELDFPRYECFK